VTQLTRGRKKKKKKGHGEISRFYLNGEGRSRAGEGERKKSCHFRLVSPRPSAPERGRRRKGKKRGDGRPGSRRGGGKGEKGESPQTPSATQNPNKMAREEKEREKETFNSISCLSDGETLVMGGREKKKTSFLSFFPSVPCRADL